MRTIVFDEDGPHDLGDLDVGQVHNVIADAVGEAEGRARSVVEVPCTDDAMMQRVNAHVRKTLNTDANLIQKRDGKYYAIPSASSGSTEGR